jgi:RNA polymerase sigma-70 factor (ECF subfamily)
MIWSRSSSKEDAGASAEPGVLVKTLDRPAEVPESVVAAVRRGDPRAFGEIVATYDTRLRSLVYRLVGADGSLQDVMQDIYLALFRGFPGFRGDSSVATWVYRVAYTTCLRHLKARARQFPVPGDPEASGTTPDHAATIALRQDLAAALAQLPPEQRAVVLLVDRDGFDYGSAAQVLDVPAGTIGSRLSTARAHLRRTLAEPTGHGVVSDG